MQQNLFFLVKSKLRTKQVDMKVILQICPKVVVMATSLRQSEKQVWISKVRSNTYHLVKEMVK